MNFAEFLVANQAVIAPIIEWGGALLFITVVLSPFLIIRHHFFKPTRWWTIVGAYVASLFIFITNYFLLEKVGQWILHGYLTTMELDGAFFNAILKHNLWLLLAWPLLIFYSTKLMYGSFTKKRFIIASLVTVVFTVVMLRIVLYVMMYGLGALVGNF